MPRRRNPVPPSIRVQRRNAEKLFADFTGHAPEHFDEFDKPQIPDVCIGVGSVDAICYTTVRDGQVEKYIHEFKPHARPLFAVSHDGKQLLLLGGAYRFTERGIVDKRLTRRK